MSYNITRRDALALMGGGALAALHVSCSAGSDSGSESGSEPASGSGTESAAVDGPLHYASLTDVARLIESGEISPVELTQMMLERIETLDGRLHSYATLMGAHALAAAVRAEREIQAGYYRGPLHGVPVAVKDLCYTKGVRTMGGLAVLADFVPDHDATVVVRLEEAGAVLLGKLNLTEGAMGGYHPDFEVPVNPWDQELWSGASSSGSGVATAAGLCFASLGSDTGGSIRFPSMANGIVGLKPTYGRVSRYGVLPLAESLDHVGPMTRRTADAAIVLEAIAGFDPADATSLRAPVPSMLAELDRGIVGVRLGFDRGFATEGVDADLLTSMDAALGELERLGASIVPVEMPAFPDSLRDAWFTISSYEARKAHAANFPSRADEYGAYFRDFLEFGSGVTDAAYGEASRLRGEFSERLRATLAEVDAVAVPAGGVPFRVPRELLYRGMDDFGPVIQNVWFRFTAPADFAGTPSLTIPCGANTDGVPHTIQFMGSGLSEPLLCRIGHVYEEATDWHTRHPDV